jgi:hypothetical protein
MVKWSEELIDNAIAYYVENDVKNIGLNLTTYKHTQTTELYFTTTAYNKAFAICELLYEDCTLYLDRKISLYKEIRPLYK